MGWGVIAFVFVANLFILFVRISCSILVILFIALSLSSPRTAFSSFLGIQLASTAKMGKGGTTESPDELPGVKTKRITNASKKRSKNSERRLVEYFCVVSSIPKKNVDGAKSVEMTASLAASGGGAADIADAKEAGKANAAASSSTNPFDGADSRPTAGDDNEDEFQFVDDNDFQPVITARYPLEDHKGNPLQESITCFCHPGGAINLRLEPCMPKVSI